MLQTIYVVLAAFDSPDNAREVGRTCGTVFWTLLLAAGLLKCIQVMRRPTASTVCVLSLTLVLGAWMASTLMRGVAVLADLEGVAKTAMDVATAALVLLMTAAAFVLAIVGLAQYGNRKPPYAQGRAQAIWAIVLCIFMVGLLAVGAVVGFVRAGGGAMLQGGTPAAVGEPQEFAAQNFRVKVPGAGWVETDAKKFNEAATAMFMRSRPQTFFMVIAETDAGADLNTELLAEVSLVHLRSGAETATTTERFEETRAGIRGIRFHSDAVVDGQRLTYVHWVGVHGGAAYQLITAGNQKDRSKIREAADQWLSGFELIDPAKVFGRTDPPAKAVSERALGYAAFYPADWYEWPEMHETMPAALHGVQQTSSCFAIFALPLEDLKADDDSVYAAMLDQFGVQYPGGSLDSVAPVSQGDASGIEVRFRDKADGTPFEYRVRVLRRGSMAYMLTAWALDGTPGDDAAGLTRVFESVRLFDPSGSAERSVGSRQREGWAAMLNLIGLRAYDAQRYEEATPFIDRAVELAPNDVVYARNLVRTFTQQRRWAEALERTDEALKRFPRDGTLGAIRGFCLGELGRLDEAAVQYEQTFATGYRNDDYVRDYVWVLGELDRHDDALDAIARWHTAASSPSADRMRSVALITAERADEAATLLRSRLDAGPFDAETATALVEAHRSAEQSAEALALLEELRGRGHDRAYLWELKGLTEYDLGWYPAAKASFEAARAAAPSNPNYRDWVDHLSSMLGRGDVSLVRKPIEPVLVPEAMRARLASAAENTAVRSDAFERYFEHHVTVIDPASNGEMRRTVSIRAVATGPNGVERLSTLRFHFNPGGEDLYVNHVRVLDERGNIVSEPSIETFYVLDDRSEDMATRDKELHVPVPGLRPGYTVDYRATWRERSAAEGLPYTSRVFANVVPAKLEAVVVLGDGELTTWVNGPQIESIAVPGARAWYVTDPPIFASEWRSAEAATYLPTLALQGAGPSWEALAADYLADLREHFELTDPVRSTSAEIAPLHLPAEERVALLARHVQREYVYKAIEFGRRARIPHRAAQVMQDRYGDCKDQALLLQQLLAASGIEAHLALTDTYRKALRDLPSLDQFNHVVVYVPGVRGGILIDPTDKNDDAVRGIPYHLHGLDAFVLDPQGPRFLDLPQYIDEPGMVAVTREADLDEHGAVSVAERVSIEGYYGGAMRTWLLDQEPEKRLSAVQSWLSQYDGPRIESAEFHGLDQPGAPVVIDLRYRLAGVFHRVGETLVGHAPNALERDYLEVPPIPQRLTPLVLEVPLHVTSRTTLRPPAGWRVAPLPRDAGEDEFGSWRFASAPAADDALLLQYECRTRTGRFPTERFPAFTASREAALRPVAGRIVAQPGR